MSGSMSGSISGSISGSSSVSGIMSSSGVKAPASSAALSLASMHTIAAGVSSVSSVHPMSGSRLMSERLTASSCGSSWMEHARMSLTAVEFSPSRYSSVTYPAAMALPMVTDAIEQPHSKQSSSVGSSGHAVGTVYDVAHTQSARASAYAHEIGTHACARIHRTNVCAHSSFQCPASHWFFLLHLHAHTHTFPGICGYVRSGVVPSPKVVSL